MVCDVVALRVLLPRFHPGIHRALAAADITLFRVPRLANEPIDVRLELEGSDERAAKHRVMVALQGECVVLPGDFGVSTVMSNVQRRGDGAPETIETIPSFWISPPVP